MSASQTTIEVIPALPEQEPILANLLELYAYDFSEIVDLELGPDGRFGYKQLPLYWQEPGRHPFFIQVNGYLAGFVLLCKGSQLSGDEEVWDVTEFFIARRYRRHGIGMKVAHEVWKMFPGKWEVRVRDRNQKAREFWDRAVGEFLGSVVHPTPFKKNDDGWHVLSFESKGTT